MTDKFQLDNDALSAYLETKIEGFKGPLESRKFSGGQSNPTYLLTTPDTQYVLRRKPPGRLLPGAHAVDREYTVLSALAATQVPVAEVKHLCDDESIIGSMFYVMEFLDGQVLWDPSLPDHSPEQRTAIYQEMNRVLCELHKVDVDKVGLQKFGRKDGYFERQINTWTKQYRASETRHIPDVESLIEWLNANLPEGDDKFSIVHGDYRLDNLMFNKKETSVIGVLDWELSTIGHPYADLAYQCMLYFLPSHDRFPGLAGLDYQALGIPTQSEYIAQYCERMGLDGISNWNFYLAFSLFRLAAICQGVEKRGLDGNASSDQANTYGDLVTLLANSALKVAHSEAGEQTS